MSKKLQFAFSPCPNDTFAFDALVHDKIKSSIAVEPFLFDIEKLNAFACEKRFPITKVSAFCLGKLTKDYVLLESGIAAGFGVGPKLIAKNTFPLSELNNKVVAIPGTNTTANLLLQLLLPKPKAIITLPYDQITQALLTNTCDAGVIIHETRFSFASMGLHELADLGSLFTERFNCPIPLGAIVGLRSLGKDMLKEISRAIKQSVIFAKNNPKSSWEYVFRHAQEKDEQMIKQHIDLYVNDETIQASKPTLKAFSILFKEAIKQNLLDSSALNFLDNGILQ
jgi:1,4-dihydroxy-6-naphthoate synthase